MRKVLAATLGLALILVASPAMALSGGASTVFSSTNSHRSANGLPALSGKGDMDTVAQNWAKKMSDANNMSHNPNYSSQIPGGWTAAGENVAYNCGYGDKAAATMMDGWKKSSGHNANMLNKDFTHMGVGFYTDDEGCSWGVQVFAKYGKSEPAPKETPKPKETKKPVPKKTEEPKSEPKEAKAPAPKKSESPKPKETKKPAPEETQSSKKADEGKPAPKKTEESKETKTPEPKKSESAKQDDEQPKPFTKEKVESVRESLRTDLEDILREILGEHFPELESSLP